MGTLHTQLSLIRGGEVDHPPPRSKRLTWRQKQLLAYLRTYGPKRGCEVSTHANPWGALRRLEALGLVSQGFDGRWRVRR